MYRCRAEYAHVIKCNAHSYTSVNIYRASASNIDVFSLDVDIDVDPRLEIISFL